MSNLKVNSSNVYFKKPSSSTGKIRKQICKERPSPIPTKYQHSPSGQNPRCKSDLNSDFERIDFPKGSESKENTSDPVNVKTHIPKTNGNKTFSSVKNAFDTITERLRSSARRNRGMSDNTYTSLNNSFGESPVKLYSPFAIETPSPSGKSGNFQRFQTRTCTPRKFSFSSPTGKLKSEVQDISEGINDLNIAALKLQGKISKNKN